MTTNNSANYQPTQYNVLSGGPNGAINNISPSTLGHVLTSNGAGAQPTFQALTASMGTLIDTQVFTANGTWTKPADATYVDVLLIGSGGGGGSGRRGAANSNRQGGSGGSAGYIVFIKEIPISFLGSTEAVVAPAGGNGGAAQTSDSTSGIAGSAGSAATFSIFSAHGGSGGSAGTTNGAPGSSGSYSTVLTGIYSPISQNTNIILTGSSSTASLYSACVSLGGGGAGEIDFGNAITNGDSSSLLVASLSASAATASASSGAAGQNAVAFRTYYACGGAGGSSSVGFAGFRGGNGLNGSGGGGGSSAVNGGNSGAGGNGGNAVVVVLTYQ